MKVRSRGQSFGVAGHPCASAKGMLGAAVRLAERSEAPAGKEEGLCLLQAAAAAEGRAEEKSLGAPGHLREESGRTAPFHTAQPPVGFALAPHQGRAAGGVVTSERRGGKVEPVLPCKAVVKLSWHCLRVPKRNGSCCVTGLFFCFGGSVSVDPWTGGRDAGGSDKRTRKPPALRPGSPLLIFLAL